MPEVIRNIRGFDEKEMKKKGFNTYPAEFTNDDRKFLDSLKEFYTQGRSDLLDLYVDKIDEVDSESE